MYEKTEGINGQEMNEENKLNRLSYKELQAEALKYKIPGNIRVQYKFIVKNNWKKNLLIKVLRAVKEGNDLEVERILHELRQTRKKRGKKANKGVGKMYKGPLLNYHTEFHGDVHYYRNSAQDQYQWIAGEEEVRESGYEVNRGQIPSIEEFHQFLSNGIQQRYTNERSQSPAIVDLRINSDRIDKWDNGLGINDNNRAGNVSNYQPLAFDHKSFKTIDTIGNLQQESSRLLKKMLQAPAGTNLKQFASYETLHHLPSMNNNPTFDDSDTLTADSESNINYNQMEDENKWVNNNEPHFIKNTGGNNIEHYRFSHNSSSDIIENCQKWLANSSCQYIENINNNSSIAVVNNDYQECANPLSTKIHNNSMCYYHPEDQYWSSNVEQKYSSNEYENPYQNQYQGDLERIEEMERVDDDYVINGENNEAGPIDDQNYSQELINSRSGQSFNLSRIHSVFHNRETLQSLYDGNQVECVEQQLEKCDTVMTDCQNHDSQHYEQYIKYNCEKSEYFEDLSENYTRDSKKMGFNEGNLVANEVPVVENDLSSGYWPQWTSSNDAANLQRSPEFRLENLLNLQTLAVSSPEDQTKSDQTSCVYCYTSPIVTQRIFPTSSAYL